MLVKLGSLAFHCLPPKSIVNVFILALKNLLHQYLLYVNINFLLGPLPITFVVLHCSSLEEEIHVNLTNLSLTQMLVTRPKKSRRVIQSFAVTVEMNNQRYNFPDNSYIVNIFTG